MSLEAVEVAAASSDGYSTRAIASAAGASSSPGRVHRPLEFGRDLDAARLQVQGVCHRGLYAA